MVDAFVSFAVQKLGDFLIQEASLRSSLRQDVRWLRNELFFMQVFLKDAEQKQVVDQRVQQWVFEINSVANDAVAILETYSLEASKGNDARFASRLKACTCICRKETKFYNVSKEIQSLKHRIMDISRKRETYGIRDINNADLRHLVVSYSKPLKLISKLTSLQVLKAIHRDQWKDVDPVDLVNLRELTMHDITKTYSLNNISSLKNLSSLKLLRKDCESFPALEFLYSCQKLHKLWLQGRIEKLPLSDQFPNSIIMMILSGSELTEDPMPTLGMLPNLRNLDLFRAYGGKEITCIDNSFSQLEILRLDCLENLERWHLATSAMPHIKGFANHRCPKLHEIPERMKDVETLKRDRLR